MESEEQVKKLLSCLIISSPKSLTVRRLQQDYLAEIGKNIPYRSFGYESLESYLRSIPEVCRVNGTGHVAIVEPVINDKVKHINNMIIKQKTVARSKGIEAKPKEKNSHWTNRDLMNRNQIRPGSLTSESSSSLASIQEPCCSHSLNHNIDSIEVHSVWKKDSSQDIYQPSAKNNLQQPERKSTSLLETIRLLRESSQRQKLTENFTQTENETNHPVSSCRAGHDKINTVEMSMKEYVKRNLRLLIHENHNGIWSSQLIHFYRRRFEEILDPSKFGFSTINDYCRTLTDVFVIVRLGESDWKLFDLRNPPIHLLTQEETYSFSDIYGNNIPQEVLLVDDEIERQWLPDNAKRGAYIDIVIAEVYNPTKFYIQLTREDDYSEKFLDNMEEFYTTMNASYRLLSNYVEQGLYCVAHFRNQFNRAIIHTKLDDETVTVFSIDYGTNITVKVKDLHFMNKRFSSLPQQALKSRLSSISPRNGPNWPLEASKRFFQLCNKKDLVGNLNYIDEENQILYLVVTDITDVVDIHINDTLIDEGHAVLDYNRR